MKYFVILIRTAADDTASKSIYEFDAESAAVASFHSNLGTVMKDAAIKSCLCMAINSIGGICKMETFSREEMDNNE